MTRPAIVLLTLFMAFTPAAGADDAAPPADAAPRAGARTHVVADPGKSGNLPPLDRWLERIEVTDATFEQVLDAIRDETRANLVFDERGAAAAGFDRKRVATLRLYDVTVGQVLDVLFAVYSRDLKMAAEERDGIVYLGAEESVRESVTRMYDVRLLIELMCANGSRGALGPKGTGEEEVGVRSYGESLSDIISMVEATVDPTSWRDSGGSVGAIRELSGRLLITTTPANHKWAAAYLKELEAEFAKPVPERPISGRPSTRPATAPTP